MLSINGADKNSYDVTHTFFLRIIVTKSRFANDVFYTKKQKKKIL